MTSDPSSPPAPRRLRRPGTLGRALGIVAVAVVVVLAGLGVYVDVNATLGGPTLVVYTYPSLLGGTDCGGSPAFNWTMGTFAAAHHVRVVVECPPGNLLNTLA